MKIKFLFFLFAVGCVSSCKKDKSGVIEFDLDGVHHKYVMYSADFYKEDTISGLENLKYYSLGIYGRHEIFLLGITDHTPSPYNGCASLSTYHNIDCSTCNVAYFTYAIDSNTYNSIKDSSGMFTATDCNSNTDAMLSGNFHYKLYNTDSNSLTPDHIITNGKIYNITFTRQ